MASVGRLRGDLALDDDPDPIPDFLGYDENSWHVVTGSGNDATATIDGVTITAGNASGPAQDDHDTGDGLSIHDGHPIVRNCRFEFNRPAKRAGIEIKFIDEPETSDWTISGSTFIGNVAHGSGGGAIRCRSVTSSVTISNCSFIANRSTQANNAGGKTTLSNSTVVSNSAGGSGGGVISWTCFTAPRQFSPLA